MKAIRLIFVAVMSGLLAEVFLFSFDCRELNKDRFCKRLMLSGNYVVLVADLTRSEDNVH